MTIRDVEQRTGLERATVRFYEKEELIAPLRLDNGYRDYSEEDVTTLLRIKLLRELDVSIEDIHALQSGEQALPDTLARQMSALERRLEETARTRDTCRAIRDEGVSYGELDAEKYLNRILPQSGVCVPDRDKPKPPYCPWRRYFARMLDLSIYGLFWTALLTLVLHVNIIDRPAILQWLDDLAALLMMLFLEPLWLQFWGTTPGKALFGLRIERADGRRMAYFDGLERTVNVLWQGMGFHIPIYSLIRLWKSYNRHAEGEMPWDDEEYSYEVKEQHFLRSVGYVVSILLVMALSVVMGLYAQIPPNRGELTVAEFAENYNFITDFNHIETTYILDENGAWTRRYERDNSVSISLGGDSARPEISYTVEDGRVTAVHLESRGSGTSSVMVDWVDWPDLELQIAVIAMAAGEGDYTFSGGVDRLLKQLQNQEAFSDFLVYNQGLIIQSEVSYSGYKPAGGMLMPLADGEPEYSLRLSITLAE